MKTAPNEEKFKMSDETLHRLIKKFHLNEFWPLLGFSFLLGFTLVGFIFATAKVILVIINDGKQRDAYDELPINDEALLTSIESAQTISNGTKMTEATEQSSLLRQDSQV